MIQTQFTAAERESLCETLGDSPFTVISTHDIRLGMVNLALVGTVFDIGGLVVQLHEDLTEPCIFGNDVTAMTQAMSVIQGWTCVNVDETIALPLSETWGQVLNRPFRFYGDWHYILEEPISISEVNIDGLEIRLLQADDIAPLMASSHEEVDSWFSNAVTACAMKSGQVLAMAHLTSVSARYGNIGVYTNAQWRKRGLSTAVSSMVARRIQDMGLIPVWSTGEDNIASQRVAQKLGMTEYGKRMYLIVE